MGEYRISELAERTGFAPSALRYYERVGLLPDMPRTASGYRQYGEHDVERLRFIANAKRLGLPLDEIRDLVEVWAGGSCAPVQQQLRTTVKERIDEVDKQVIELAAFSRELTKAWEALGQHTPEGPCADGCGCVSTTKTVDLTRRPPATDTAIACSLDQREQSTRMTEWASLLRSATRTTEVVNGLRVHFGADATIAGRIADLAAREQECCRFFDFTLSMSTDEYVLDIHAPAGSADLAALFGELAS